MLQSLHVIDIYLLCQLQPLLREASSADLQPVEDLMLISTEGRLEGVHFLPPSSSSSLSLSVEDRTDCAAICRMATARAAD